MKQNEDKRFSIEGCYKNTPIGRVPEEWEVVQLGDVTKNLIVPMRDKPKKFNGGIPWCRIEDFDGKYLFTSKSGQFVDKEIIDEMNLKIFPKGTVICSCSANLGICAIAGRDLITNQTFIGIVPNTDSLDNEFLYYLMGSYARRLNQLSTGTTISYLPREEFEGLQVIKPPLPEQRKIAAILSTVDAAITETDALIAKTEQVKRGLMQELFDFGIDISGKIRRRSTNQFKTSPLGAIPVEWDCLKIGEIYSDISSGSTPSRKRPDYFTGDILWVTSGELKYNVIHDTKEKITNEAVKNTNLKIHPPGTFFIAITGLEAEGTLGSCAIIGKEATTNQSCMAFPENPRIDTIYLYHYYRRYGKYLGTRYSHGTKQQSLNAEIVKGLQIKLPPKSEQHRIATILSNVDSRLYQENQFRSHLNTLKKGLMQDLLTGRVRVNPKGVATNA